MQTLLWLVPALPLAGFLVLTLGGARLPRAGVPWVGAGSVGLSALLTALIGANFMTGAANGEMFRQTLWTWMAAADLDLTITLYLDALSLAMMLVVTGVGFLIHVYSAGYMADDPGYGRFFAYMNLFVFAMLVLVLADNLVLLYLGWEGVGLCSYLLIGFWYRDPANGYAARKAFIVTRVGDTAMALGLFLLFTHLGTLDIQDLVQRAGKAWTVASALPTAVALLLLGGAVGKSAQLPLQTWLPDAMAGPTPISALIHAATMVTAGVYLIARTHEIFLLAPDIQLLVAIVGCLTLLMSGFTALTQTDIKRVLAYSTISQIGYMFLALGVGAWSAAIFHLMTHAFFKALLFLAAGAVILSLHHEQNIFKMGGLWKRLPIAFWSFLIGTAALVALPFTSGYYSKHEILLAAYARDGAGPWLWGAGTLGALITGVYGFRLLLIAFFGPDKAHAEEKLGLSMVVPLVLLSALSLAGGLLEMPLQGVLPVTASTDAGAVVNWVTIAAPFLGASIALVFYATRIDLTERLMDDSSVRRLHGFFYGGWGMDPLYDTLFVRPYGWLAALNKGDILDALYRSIAELTCLGHRLLVPSQSGRLRWYAAGMAGGAALVIALGVLG